MSVWIVWDEKYRQVIAVFLHEDRAMKYAKSRADWQVFPQIVADA